MPDFQADDTQETWMARCMPAMIGEGRDQDQAAAACSQMWRDHTKSFDVREAFLPSLLPEKAMMDDGWVEEVYEGYVIIRSDEGYFKAPYTKAEDGIIIPSAQGEWQTVSKEWVVKHLPSRVRVKSMTEDTAIVAGYGVVFGGIDLTGEHFEADTDFKGAFDLPSKPVFYDHTLQPEVKNALGKTIKEKADDIGIWVEAQIDLSREYAREVLGLVEKGLLGWSSGTVAHLTDKLNGLIKRWPIVEFSLTPTPAEPRTLGVEHIKALYLAAGLTLPEALAEAPQGAPARQEADAVAEGTKEVPDMDGTGAKPVVEPSAPTALTTEQIAEIAGKAAVDAIKALMAEEPAKKGGVLYMPAIKKVTDRGFADDEMKSFRYYLLTGDQVAYRAAMQGQTDDEGGYAVPDDFYARIVAKRDEKSVVRQAGVTVIPTSLDRILVPTEGTSATAFVRTAEEGAVDENEPTLGQVIITVHRNTKLVKASVEWMADNKGGGDSFLADVFARAEAKWENDMYLTGSGTNQPQGAVTASGAGLTAAGTNAITAANMITLVHSLGDFYADGSWLFMRNSTLGALRALTGNPFAFAVTPQGNATLGGREILGYPVGISGQMDAMTTGLKPVLFGNFEFYAIAERQGMFVQRLIELYAGTGQVGLLASFRRGGAALQAEAFKHLLLS
ncbi:MAG TPA: phage major capsid protein [Thermoleophilia bacterium]|nr:phage major capsid protein [Thermoleophilia bacterium]